MTHDNIRRIREIGEKLVDPELTAQIFEELADALVLIDRHGTIQLVNRQTEILFGYRRTELYDQPLDMLLPDDHHAAHRADVAAYFAAPHRRPMGIGEQRFMGRRKDGTEFPVDIMLGPIVTHTDTFCVASLRLRAVHNAAPSA